MLRGKAVLVTGASSGLGASLSEAFAERGARLVLFARSRDRLEEVAGRCRELGGSAVAVAGDVTRAEDCCRAVETAVAQFGGVDVLVACAGVSMWAKFEEVRDLSVFRRLVETNYLGVVNCIHYALPHLKQSRGMVVAVSSIQGKIGVPLHTGYVASKHALQGFLAALRTEVEEVHFLTVLPHWLRGTELRRHAFGKDGKTLGDSSRSHSRESISLEVCSRAVIRAMEKRKRELVIPGKLRVLPWLNLIHPKIVEFLVKRKVEEQEE